jgi:hypothetical protein
MARSRRSRLLRPTIPSDGAGDEYREGIGDVEDDSVEEWAARAEQASAWLEAACRKKLNKLYSARANLVIYLNLNEFGIRQQSVQGCFPAVTEKVKDSFDAVWVLWKEAAYLMWSGGEAQRLIKRAAIAA